MKIVVYFHFSIPLQKYVPGWSFLLAFMYEINMNLTNLFFHCLRIKVKKHFFA